MSDVERTMEELVFSQDVLRATVHRAGPPTCISNDNAHEMIEVGWNNGGISVYRPVITHDVADMVHWTSFPAHRSAVLQTLGSYGAGLYSVSAKTFKIHTHGGAEVFALNAPSRTSPGTVSSNQPNPAPVTDDFTSFSPLSAVRFAVGTKSGKVYETDLQYGRLVSSSIGGEGLHQEITKLCTTDRSVVVMGTHSGSVVQWDHRSKRLISEFKATTGGRIFDMDVSGELAVTCGFSSKGTREPFLRVFDLRTQRQLSPIQFLTPSSVRFVPNPFVSGSASSTILVISANGNIRMTDIRGDPSSDSYARVQTGGGNIEGLATSCTGRSFSLVDSTGHIHFWATNVKAGWNICDSSVLEAQPFAEIEHPHPLETQATSLSHYGYWGTDDACASYVSPFVPQEIPKLSDFPKSVLDLPLKNSSASLRIHPDLLGKISQRDYVGYVSNTTNLPGLSLLFGKEKHGEAYVDVDPREAYVHHHKRSATRQARSKSDSSIEETEAEAGENDSDEDVRFKKDAKEVKRKYARQTSSAIQVTIFEQDFSEVNTTQFAGLEVDYDPNNFVNAPLQLLYFLPEFRADVLSLPFSSKPVCIPTETGILFRLLDKTRQLPSKAKACQARNFHRAFRLSPDALALGLLEPSKLPNDRRAGAFIRFVFTQFLAAGGSAREQVETLFAVKFSQRDTWEHAGKRQASTRETSAVVVDVVDDERTKQFEATVSATLRQEKKHRSWSDQVKAQVNVTTVKTPLALSPYIVFNCADMFKREETLEERFFCESFGYVVEKAQVVPMRDPTSPPPGGAEIFDVVAVVSRITDVDRARQRRSKTKPAATAANPSTSSSKSKVSALSVPEDESKSMDGHLVLHVKLQSDYGQLADEQQFGNRIRPGTWMLFNDISVSASSLSDALDFTSRFRAPAVIVYKRRVDPSLLPPVPKVFEVSPEVFLTPPVNTPARKQRHSQNAAATTTNAFIPDVKRDDLIAIDCEFVALTNDVYDVKPDGTKIVVAPRQLALARVSCLTEDGRVILDDYVAMGPEPVVDYLTRFSGLVPGDLDPTISTRNLLQFRVVYSKLLYLVEKGCVFVGHGLENDFKVVNLVIPPNQIRDTVQLFWMRGQRMLSLRFLSAVLLSEEIQDRIHDSIQDARAALKLFLKYRELEASGKLEETLRRVYLEGPVRNWS